MRNPFRKITRSKRHRRTLKLVLAPLGIALFSLLLIAQNPEALAAAWHSSGNFFTRNAAPQTAALRDPADVLAERSPGTRDPNALYSIKPERIAPLSELASVLPHERVLSVVRDRPGTDLPAFGLDDPVAGLFPSDPLTFGTPSLTGFAPPAALSTGGGAPGLSGGSPGGGASALVPTFPAGPAVSLPDPPAEVDVPSAVPEPSTWLMNIAGFFAIAGMLRLRRRTTRDLVPVLG